EYSSLLTGHVFDLDNLILPGPRRHLDLDGIIEFVSDQGLTDRRSTGDFSEFDIGFFLADDLVANLFFARRVVKSNGRAENDLVRFEIGKIDNIGTGKLILKLLDTPLYETLPVLCGIVLRIFRKIAMCTGLGNILNNLGALFADHPLELFLQRLMTLFCHWYRV